MEIFDLEKHLEDAKNRKILDEEDFIGICDYVLEILVEEPTVCAVTTPVTICGDIHGQFYDLLQLFKMGGQVPFTKYVFMGDYVDRGYYSLETLCLLICFKARYPDRITLLRGNHESRQVSQTYGFYDECKKRYGNVLPWQKCMEVFDCLPVAAIVDDTILCVHGGLSPDLRTLDQIRVIPRRQEIPQSGGFSDLMWSDPDSTVPAWVQSQRGAGYLFGERVTRQFNHLNSISLICRAHQLVMEGYKHSFSDSSLVTIWSAPNYCYRCGNVAAIMQISEKLNGHFVIFSEVPESMREVPPAMPVQYFM